MNGGPEKPDARSKRRGITFVGTCKKYQCFGEWAVVGAWPGRGSSPVDLSLRLAETLDAVRFQAIEVHRKTEIEPGVQTEGYSNTIYKV